MKIGGIEVNKPNEDFLVIPRGSGPDIVFRGIAIADFTEFNALCPIPKPPKLNHAKHGKIDDVQDKGYIQQMDNYLKEKTGWMVFKTLEPSEIEWEHIDREKSNTWPSWEKELAESGFTAAEQQRIMLFVLEVNSLNESKIERARADFLRSLAQESLTE